MRLAGPGLPSLTKSIRQLGYCRRICPPNRKCLISIRPLVVRDRAIPAELPANCEPARGIVRVNSDDPSAELINL